MKLGKKMTRKHMKSITRKINYITPCSYLQNQKENKEKERKKNFPTDEEKYPRLNYQNYLMGWQSLVPPATSLTTTGSSSWWVGNQHTWPSDSSWVQGRGNLDWQVAYMAGWSRVGRTTACLNPKAWLERSFQTQRKALAALFPHVSPSPSATAWTSLGGERWRS